MSQLWLERDGVICKDCGDPFRAEGSLGSNFQQCQSCWENYCNDEFGKFCVGQRHWWVEAEEVNKVKDFLYLLWQGWIFRDYDCYRRALLFSPDQTRLTEVIKGVVGDAIEQGFIKCGTRVDLIRTADQPGAWLTAEGLAYLGLPDKKTQKSVEVVE